MSTKQFKQISKMYYRSIIIKQVTIDLGRKKKQIELNNLYSVEEDSEQEEKSSNKKSKQSVQIQTE